jgi:hypothetical protein
MSDTTADDDALDYALLDALRGDDQASSHDEGRPHKFHRVYRVKKWLIANWTRAKEDWAV